MDYLRKEDYRGFRWYSFDDVDNWTEAENWYPSATTVIGIVKDYGLIEWMKNADADEIENKISGGTGVGTIVHDKIEEMLVGGGSVSISGVDEDKQKHVSQCLSGFCNWYSQNNVETINTEITVLNSDLGIAGTFDWQGRINGEPWIVDWKTSNQKDDFKWAQQVSIYGRSDPFQEAGIDPNLGVLHLKKGRRSTKKGFTFREYEDKTNYVKMLKALFDEKYGTEPKFSDPVETEFSLEG